MRVSIRLKITLMVMLFATFVVGASWVVCTFFIEDIFINNLKGNLKKTYNSCNAVFDDDIPELNTGDLYGSVENPIGAVIIIFDPINKRLFSTINDESQMMNSISKIVETLNDSRVEGYVRPGEYVIKKNLETLTNAYYYDLIGTLNNGFIVIIRSPMAQIDTTVALIQSVFNNIAVWLIILGTVFILFFSNIFSAPIKRLSHVARKMTKLDFTAKVPVYTKDEIGDLSQSMNELSSKLESTISELKAANIELSKDIEEKRQIDEMRKEFLSHVSHELKTPIALIQGYAEGLKDNLCDDEESREFYTDVIIDESRKMNVLVKKLLTLNEIEFGGVSLKIERFELVDFIKDIISSSKILISDVETDICFEETKPVYVWADEYMIEEVFTNYLTNAMHYVCQGGIIRVYFEHYDNVVRVCVYNQGENITEEDINKLFIKFYKADKARTREYGGNGIGLSIVAATMQAHGREYGVYNVEDGVVFYFDLDANMPC